MRLGLCRCAFQRCFLSIAVVPSGGTVINVGPILLKYVDHFRKPGAASLHQRRLEGFVFGVFVGAVVQSISTTLSWLPIVAAIKRVVRSL